ncbi:MAG: ATP-binding cassette domain-containing protein, partial [Promethearchaeota archaeon]
MPPKLVVEQVSKQYTSNGQKLWAVQDVSFKVATGEFLCLVGPSGCGKTTLLKIIAALETPTTGRVTLDGLPTERQREKISFVFQGFTLF